MPSISALRWTSVSWRPAWSTYEFPGLPGLCRKTLQTKQKQNPNNHHGNSMSSEEMRGLLFEEALSTVPFSHCLPLLSKDIAFFFSLQRMWPKVQSSHTKPAISTFFLNFLASKNKLFLIIHLATRPFHLLNHLIKP